MHHRPTKGCRLRIWPGAFRLSSKTRRHVAICLVKLRGLSHSFSVFAVLHIARGVSRGGRYEDLETRRGSRRSAHPSHRTLNMQRRAMSPGRQHRCWLAHSSLASLSAWCLRFLPAVLASVLLWSEAARSQQQVGPGLVTTPITGNQNVTVVGSTQLMPNPGTVAVSPSGSAFVTFNPALVQPGPLAVHIQDVPAIVITGGTT